MGYIHIALTSIGSIIVLFILTKLMGFKQVSQLSTFDYITGITIGSIAAEMATSLEDDFMEPLIAMVIYGVAAYLISRFCMKWITFRRKVSGNCVLLYDNGKIYEKNFEKAKMDIDEFLMLCRNSGYFDISNLQSIVLESNGKLSFLPKSDQRPTIPQDFNLIPPQDKIVATIIEDGNILYDNLKNSGQNTDWLMKELKKQHIDKAEDVFLATCDDNNTLNVYVKLGENTPKDKLN